MSRIFWVGMFPPEVNSLGDHAQTWAVQRWFQDNFPGWEVHRIFRPEAMSLLKSRDQVEKGDLVFIASSGDFGSFYADEENPNYGGFKCWHRMRREIIRVFASQGTKVIQLPVTIHYGNGDLLKEDEESFSRPGVVENFTLCTRDCESFRLAKEHFKCRVLMVPDFTLYTQPQYTPLTPRRGVLVVSRHDRERVLTTDERTQIFRKLFAWSPGEILDCDPHITNFHLTDQTREVAFRNLLQLYTGKDLVVTDRFHGVVFSAITQTPCVALPERIPHKAQGMRSFLPPFIQFCRGSEEFEECLDRALKGRTSLSSTPVDMRPHFLELAHQIQTAPAVAPKRFRRKVAKR